VNNGYHHSVGLSDLSPSTTYYYMVGDETGGFSTPASFRSAGDKSDVLYCKHLLADEFMLIFFR
jgi:hypothetical protein